MYLNIQVHSDIIFMTLYPRINYKFLAVVYSTTILSSYVFFRPQFILQCNKTDIVWLTFVYLSYINKDGKYSNGNLFPEIFHTFETPLHIYIHI